MKTYSTRVRTLSAVVTLVAGATLTALPVAAAPIWGAYHDATPAQHKQKFDWFSRNGFRMLSLSVYNTPSNPLHAAVWVKLPGPAYQSWQQQSSSGYQKKVEEGWAIGFRPTIATATSSGSSTSYSCVLEADNQVVSARHGIDWYTVYYLNDQAKSKKWSLKWIDSYGSAGSPRYTAIWEKNTTGADWRVHSNLNGSTLDSFIDSYKEDGYRITEIAVSPNGKYKAIWRTGVSGLRKIYWGMSSAEHQQTMEAMEAAGYRPVRVDAGGAGSNAVFAAIYVID